MLGPLWAGCITILPAKKRSSRRCSWNTIPIAKYCQLFWPRAETIEQFANDTIRRMLKAIHGQPEFMNLMFIEVVEFKAPTPKNFFQS